MSWTAAEIKNLRRKLGWERSDLARRLQCDPQLVTQWEDGSAAPDFQYHRLLQTLKNHAESHSHTMKTLPLVEKTIEDESLPQTSDFDLEDRE